jgi:hypothetical protein
MGMPKPKTEGRYLKAPKAGQSVTLRILSDPVEFYQAWKTDGEGRQRPIRKPFLTDFKRGDYDEANKYGTQQSPAYCQAFPVIGPTGEVMVFTAHQKTILDGLYALDNKPKWGDLTGYDVTIEGAEDGKSYSVTPDPKTPLSESHRAAWEGLVRNGFNLRLLIEARDPFKELGEVTAEHEPMSSRVDDFDPPPVDDDIPFE